MKIRERIRTTKEKLKKEKGITLIALVITIIVLLILAGVTINLTLKDGGIYKKAQIAVQNYANAQEKELSELEQFDTEVDNIINNVTRKIASKEELKKLAEEVKAGKTFEGEAVVLQSDIDLEGESWTPIGNETTPFMRNI